MLRVSDNQTVKPVLRDLHRDQVTYYGFTTFGSDITMPGSMVSKCPIHGIQALLAVTSMMHISRFQFIPATGPSVFLVLFFLLIPQPPEFGLRRTHGIGKVAHTRGKERPHKCGNSGIPRDHQLTCSVANRATPYCQMDKLFKMQFQEFYCPVWISYLSFGLFCSFCSYKIVF